MMNNRIFLVFLMIFSFSCSQKAKNPMAENENKNKTFYFIDYDYNKKCGFEIYINDVLVDRELWSVNIENAITSINSHITNAGKQEIKVVLYPLKNKENIEADAHINLKVFYLDNYNKAKVLTSPDQGKIIFDLSKAKVDKGTRSWTYTGQFDIPNIPYHVTGWSQSRNLKEIRDIEKKVRTKFALLHKALENKDAGAFMKLLDKSMQESQKFYYLTDEEQKNSIKDLEELLSRPDIEAAPLDNTVIKFYGNGRLATLETIDGGAALRVIQKRDGYKSEDAFPVLLSMPENTEELEVIR